MNLCGFTKDKINLVVDSDKRKQGYFLPGTGQMVVSPESLLTAPPDVILVLSQFHKDDIAKQIQSMFQEPPRLSSLVSDMSAHAEQHVITNASRQRPYF